MTISYIWVGEPFRLEGCRWRRGRGKGTTSARGGKLRGFAQRCMLKDLVKVQKE